MAAVFIICIPTREYEQKLEEKKSLASTTPPRNKSPDSTVANGKLVGVGRYGGGELSSWPDGGDLHLSPSKLLLVDVANIAQNDVNSSGGIDEAVILRRPNRNGSPASNGSTSPDREAKPVDDECLESVLKIGLNKLKINGAVWQTTNDKKFIQVVFPCESQERCEHILRQLFGNGIGTKKESSVSVLPCSVYYQAESDGEGEDDVSAEDVLGEQSRDNDTMSSKDKTQKTEFIKSIKARLTVAQVVDGVRGGATLTFDYVAFVLLANFIAAFGLLDNSPVTVVASMLVSPLMGPIMALSFGAVIRDVSLFQLGLKSELVGLGLCIGVGGLLGLIISPWSVAWGKGLWPTGEMFARGQARSLWVGMLVALPSGAGVALSLLGGNAGCLVGVAISASLLPPCVNAGLLWANSIVLSLRSTAEDSEETYVTYDGVTVTNKPSLLPPPGYQYQYSTNMACESAALGIISMCLTLVNIVCIIMMAIAVLKIKEVAPPSTMPATSRFWREDIKIARDYNKTVHRGESVGGSLGASIVKEWAARNGSSTGLAEMVQEAIEDDEVYHTVMRCTTSQYTMPPKTRDRMSSWAPLANCYSETKPAVWDVSFRSPKGSRGGRRRTFTVSGSQPPCDRQSRMSFITEALNPHYTHLHEAGGASPQLRRSGNTAPANRFKVTKADEHGSGTPFYKHSVLHNVVPEELQLDFKQ